jgi:hypothetical protein
MFTKERTPKNLELKIKSTSYPERSAKSFSEWHEDMLFERGVDKELENMRYNISMDIKKMYYELRSSGSTKIFTPEQLSREIKKLAAKYTVETQQ